jgi:hypothetical protein
MAVAQPPEQVAELQHSEEVLLQELQRVDEILLEELERVDQRLLQIAAAIDQLPERVASNRRRDRSGSEPRPFDPYGEDEDEVESAKDDMDAVRQVVAFAVFATGFAVVGLILAVVT